MQHSASDEVIDIECFKVTPVQVIGEGGGHFASVFIDAPSCTQRNLKGLVDNGYSFASELAHQTQMHM